MPFLYHSRFLVEHNEVEQIPEDPKRRDDGHHNRIERIKPFDVREIELEDEKLLSNQKTTTQDRNLDFSRLQERKCPCAPVDTPFVL